MSAKQLSQKNSIRTMREVDKAYRLLFLAVSVGYFLKLCQYLQDISQAKKLKTMHELPKTEEEHL